MSSPSDIQLCGHFFPVLAPFIAIPDVQHIAAARNSWLEATATIRREELRPDFDSRNSKHEVLHIRYGQKANGSVTDRELSTHLNRFIV